VAALQGSDFIVHAGDIGNAAILDELARIAPVTAVLGNNDIGGWARAIPPSAMLEAGGARIHVIHDVAQLAPGPYDVVVAGHSHRPAILERGGILFVNPGSAGPRRFSLPISVGDLFIEGGKIRPSLVTLSPAA
jgi:putative phosphoesterase